MLFLGLAVYWFGGVGLLELKFRASGSWTSLA